MHKSNSIRLGFILAVVKRNCLFGGYKFLYLSKAAHSFTPETTHSISLTDADQSSENSVQRPKAFPASHSYTEVRGNHICVGFDFCVR